MTLDERVWPCDRTWCFKQAKWIIVSMPPLTDAELDARDLGDALELVIGQQADEETIDAVLMAIVPGTGRRGGFVEIRCDNHADRPSRETFARDLLRLPVPIEQYVRLFGFPRMGR